MFQGLVYNKSHVHQSIYPFENIEPYIEFFGQYENVKILTNCGGGSLKNQFKKADKSGAEIALILGENELERKQLTVKYLRDDKPQVTIKYSEISNFLSKALSI